MDILLAETRDNLQNSLLMVEDMHLNPPGGRQFWCPECGGEGAGDGDGGQRIFKLPDGH
jgi:hypothetical protein